MRVIPPISIVDALLTSSSESEPQAGSPSTENVWSAAATYGLGAEVIETTYHRKYESLQAANINHALPDYGADETANAWWIDIGPTNKWAMFDLLRNTKTEAAGATITVVLAPGERINALAALGLEATNITVSMDSIGSPTENYYSADEDLDKREVLDWYDYFFEAFVYREAVAFFDLPPYSDARLTVTITNTQGDAACGALVIGSAQILGETQQQAESDALNFSSVTRDAFGNATMVQRRTIPKTVQEVICDKGAVNAARDLRTALNAVPAVWSALEDSDADFFEALLILGFYRRFTIRLEDPWCRIVLELEEV